jgi:hypothetical protein
MRNIIWKRHGTSSVEFAIVSMVFFMMFFGIIDFGRFMWATNSAAKATQVGVRYAIVSDPVASGITDFDCLAAAGGNGLTCPVAAVTPNPVICTVAGCNGLGPKDDAAFDAIVAAMQGIDNRIQPANVEVRYEHIGLGFAGNPFGSDIIPAVTVRLTGLVFSPVTPGFAGAVSINMSEYRTTLTGEDLDG